MIVTVAHVNGVPPNPRLSCAVLFILVLEREQMPSETSLFAACQTRGVKMCQMAAAKGFPPFYSPEI